MLLLRVLVPCVLLNLACLCRLLSCFPACLSRLSSPFLFLPLSSPFPLLSPSLFRLRGSPGSPEVSIFFPSPFFLFPPWLPKGHRSSPGNPVTPMFPHPGLPWEPRGYFHMPPMFRSVSFPGAERRVSAKHHLHESIAQQRCSQDGCQGCSSDCRSTMVSTLSHLVVQHFVRPVFPPFSLSAFASPTPPPSHPRSFRPNFYHQMLEGSNTPKGQGLANFDVDNDGDDVSCDDIIVIICINNNEVINPPGPQGHRRLRSWERLSNIHVNMLHVTCNM